MRLVEAGPEGKAAMGDSGGGLRSKDITGKRMR